MLHSLPQGLANTLIQIKLKANKTHSEQTYTVKTNTTLRIPSIDFFFNLKFYLCVSVRECHLCREPAEALLEELQRAVRSWM